MERIKTKMIIVAFLLNCTCAFTQNATHELRQQVEEELVSLAMKNNAAIKALPYKVQLAEKNFAMGQRSWWDIVKFQSNLNEFNLNPENNSRSMYYPRYNFMISFSLSDFVVIPRNVRTRKLGAEIARLDADGQRSAIRSDVLKRYNHYLSVKDRLAIQRKLESEISVNLEVARNKFNQSNETYEVLSALTEKYYSLQMATKELEESLDEARLDIEALIGVKLNTVIQD